MRNRVFQKYHPSANSALSQAKMSLMAGSRNRLTSGNIHVRIEDFILDGKMFRAKVVISALDESFRVEKNIYPHYPQDIPTSDIMDFCKTIFDKYKESNGYAYAPKFENLSQIDKDILFEECWRMLILFRSK